MNKPPELNTATGKGTMSTPIKKRLSEVVEQYPPGDPNNPTPKKALLALAATQTLPQLLQKKTSSPEEQPGTHQTVPSCQPKNKQNNVDSPHLQLSWIPLAMYSNT